MHVCIQSDILGKQMNSRVLDMSKSHGDGNGQDMARVGGEE
jgi:hypothetical protein